MQELRVLHMVGATSGSNDKVATLKNNKSDKLCGMLDICYNNFRTYRVQQIEMPDSYNTVQPDIYVELSRLAEQLEKHDTKPGEAKALIKNLLSKCTEENAGMVARIFKKDLKIGINVSSINKAFPGLIPDFKCQLAHPVEKVKYDKKTDTYIEINNWHRVKFPVGIETKLDGMRILAVCEGDHVNYFSREGLEYDTLDFLSPQILRMRPGTKFVLDGEIIGTTLNPNCKAAVKAVEAGKHFEFAQGLSMARTGNMGSGTPYPVEEMKAHTGFFVWDTIDYDHFFSQGAVGEAKPLRKRKLELLSLFERCDVELQNVKMVENFIIGNREDVKEFTLNITSNGGEGSMLKDLDAPYEFKRGYAVLKVKEFITGDFRITGAYEGEIGSKQEGLLGGIEVIEDESGITSKVGSGFDDDDLADLWAMYLAGNLVGKIAEIKYFELTYSNSLRLPTFMRMRPDKTTTSLC